jgi:hypothetical protein
VPTHIFIYPKTPQIEEKLAERCWIELRDGLFLAVSQLTGSEKKVYVTLKRSPFLNVDENFPDVYVEIITNPQELPPGNTKQLFLNISEAFKIHGSSSGYSVEMNIRDTSTKGIYFYQGQPIR